MNISGIVYDSIVDGEGVRNALFVSGCKHKCKGCHNPKTWNFENGEKFDIIKQNQFITKCKENVLLDGITLTGGDPIYSAKELIPFVKNFKKECPNLTIWIYSGFTYEEILEDFYGKQLLDLCDILVDGPYIEDLKDLSLEFRGSSNQNIVKLK